jgi:hypothetical protein
MSVDEDVEAMAEQVPQRSYADARFLVFSKYR